MAKYTVCFTATGGVDIEAENEDEAIKKFNEMSVNEPEIFSETFLQNGWEITDIEIREEE